MTTGVTQGRGARASRFCFVMLGHVVTALAGSEGRVIDLEYKMSPCHVGVFGTTSTKRSVVQLYAEYRK